MNHEVPVPVCVSQTYTDSIEQNTTTQQRLSAYLLLHDYFGTNTYTTQHLWRTAFQDSLNFVGGRPMCQSDYYFFIFIFTTETAAAVVVVPLLLLLIANYLK